MIAFELEVKKYMYEKDTSGVFRPIGMIITNKNNYSQVWRININQAKILVKIVEELNKRIK